MTKHIGILTACDSERHLSEPVYTELNNLGLTPRFILIRQNDIVTSYNQTCFQLTHDGYGNKLDYVFDLVLTVGDRKEQLGGVLSAFDNHIPVGHLYSGDINTGVSDDINRALLTLYSSIQLCSCLESENNTINILKSAGLIPNAHVVGATHFNNIIPEELDTIKFDKDYILVAINSENTGSDTELIEETISEIEKKEQIKKILIAKGNRDNEMLETVITAKLLKNNYCTTRLDRLSHKTILSLIKNCSYYITNSSSANYEAPFLMNPDNILFVGKRNKNRTPIPKEAHDGLASKRVATLIKEFLEVKK